MEKMSKQERLYSPSEWCKRYESKEVLVEQFFKFCTEVTEKARKSIKCELNIPYGITERTKYDIYGTNLPKVKMWDIVEEIKSAIEQILKYAADSGCKSVWISGHSAGAHLAANVLHDDDWIKRMTQQGYFVLLKGLFLIAGIYDLKPIVNLNCAVPLNLTDELVEAMSLTTLSEPKDRRICDVKVNVIVGDCDSPAFVEQSRQYSQKIISIVDNVEYLLLQDIDHFNIVENLLDPNYVLAKLILKSLQLS